MKKYFLIGAIGLMATAGVTATMLGSSKKKTVKHSKCTYQKTHCPSTCSKTTACY
jgi:hypothetical protein